ncbi:NAD-dependent epimerase/dehydratase family protein [Polynucleobacter sp. es-MAR-4]|uniref:NAD-dependent epimerase/dehydratase family protein n=1 Tax=Polynucleobacter sp. es-MAR-4 TaxID=1855655 RepID=UPI001C0C561C|nr:NAD-dependent epimerase/dehydratase family protein [Polynucleobacter sp. es-MAR-4]MBU3637568.1 NAD-dependent epimerase/dehydratase family protein [Polynucleobacter sp. es-MAR-4]
MNCLIMGGAGFIGSHLVDALLLNGHKVSVFDMPSADMSNLSGAISRINFHRGDFLNEDDVKKSLAGIEVVIHLVSLTTPMSSNRNFTFDIDANLVGTIKMLELAKKAGVRKIVFASSGGTVYGNPTQIPTLETDPNDPICSYGITKLAIEKHLYLSHYHYGLDYTILRISNPYGARQNLGGGLGAVTTFIWKALNDQPITIWGDGEVARDYLYISDLISAFISVIETTPLSKIYNIGAGRAYSLNEVVSLINQHLGRNVKVNYSESRKFDVAVSYLNIDRARNELLWVPKIPLYQGIAKTFQALQMNFN